MPAPVRYPSGVSGAPKGLAMGDYPLLNPINWNELVNDFNYYTAADWTVTASTGTTALAAGNGGRLLQSTAAVGADIQYNQKTPAAFSISPGFPTWFVWMGQCNDNASDLRMGLMTGGTPFAPTDGIFFEKLTAQNNVSFNLKTGGSTTTVAAVTSMAPAVDTALAFYYDGLPTPTIYIFSSTPTIGASAFGQQRFPGGTMVSAVGANASNGVLLTNMPLSVMAPGFGIRATPAAIKTLNTDYLVCTDGLLRA